MPTPEPTSPATRGSSEPFVGVAIVLAWLLASAGLGLMASGRGNAQAAALYAAAPLCPPGTHQPPAGTEPATRARSAAECRQGVSITIRDSTGPAAVPRHLTALVDGVATRVQPASPADAQLLAALPAGAQVAALRWHGQLTELSTPFGTARAADNPAAAVGGDRLVVAALLGLAAILTLVALGPGLGRLGAHLRELCGRATPRPRLVAPASPPAGERAPQVPFRRRG